MSGTKTAVFLSDNLDGSCCVWKGNRFIRVLDDDDVGKIGYMRKNAGDALGQKMRGVEVDNTDTNGTFSSGGHSVFWRRKNR